MWLVVGLGNPGKEYARTRHNAGFLVVQRLARKWQAEINVRAYYSKIAEYHKGHTKVVLALPQTFMNLSGKAAAALLAGYKEKPEKMIVIYDDLDLDLGQLRVRSGGSPGSHRGMKSIVESIGSSSFPRVRIGIGPKPEGRDAADYVLEEFSPGEWEVIQPVLDMAGEAVEMIISGDINLAMNRFNRRKTEAPSEG